MIRGLALVLAPVLAPVLALCAAPAAAQDDPAALAGAAMERLDAAAESLEAARGRRDRVAALTETVRAYEDGLAALRAGLRAAIRHERALTAAFEARSEEVSRLLGVLASIERAPAPLLLLHPAGPLGTARSGLVLAEITPALQREAEMLRRDLAEITALREVQSAAEARLAAARNGVQQARTALSQAIADRTDLPPPYVGDPEGMRALLQAADTLAAFADGLGALAAPDAPAGGLAPARGALPLPVIGTILRGFEEADAAGVARPGLVVATRPGALVTAPMAATIRYVGPLLDYGNVMILEPEADTLMVLAGLGALYGEAGQVVERGDPLGLMGGPTERAVPDASPALPSGASLSETLYIEIRVGTRPANPADWFALDRQQ
jgi:septal ring factor EnvC (AmiA/AmiB activator)